MTGVALDFVPRDHRSLSNFGGNSDDRLRRYLLMMAAFLNGYGYNTRRTYRVALQQFFDLFDWICPDDVSVAHAVAFKKWLLEHRNVSEETTYYRLSAMSSFFDYLCQPTGASEQPLITSNPFRIVPKNDIQPTPYGRSRAMKWETFVKILRSLPPDEIGMRDKAILLFFAFTGRRRAEVASLLVRDLDLSARPRSYTVRVKGGQLKTFELPKVCYDAIRAYWIIADRLDGLREDSAVFAPLVTFNNLTAHRDGHKTLGLRTINEIVWRAARRAGVADEVIGVHAIRHMVARQADMAGLRLQDIQEFLGHSNPNTTQLYINRLGGPVSAHEELFMNARTEARDIARGIGAVLPDDD